MSGGGEGQISGVESESVSGAAPHQSVQRREGERRGEERRGRGAMRWCRVASDQAGDWRPVSVPRPQSGLVIQSQPDRHCRLSDSHLHCQIPRTRPRDRTGGIVYSISRLILEIKPRNFFPRIHSWHFWRLHTLLTVGCYLLNNHSIYILITEWCV